MRDGKLIVRLFHDYYDLSYEFLITIIMIMMEYSTFPEEVVNK